MKNSKDDYSFFFSAAQATIIEKALKNVVERKSEALEKEAVKNAEKDIQEVRQKLTTLQAEKVKETYDEISTSEDTNAKESILTTDRLSPKEKLFYALRQVFLLENVCLTYHQKSLLCIP
ncbi:hypothetical protein CN585_24610 [Bacillus toyonensis]|uniref:Uncharacterized protein n=1 Tax=Bacillus toyonensis TaxID=155322 RepID=A0A2A8H9G7_9BACI|nr:hypothetical protein CN585_24610 [Bacillus toyonensis]